MASWSRHPVRRPVHHLAALTGVAAALYAGAGVGLAYVAGFGTVRMLLARTAWPWLGVAVAAAALSFLGYYVGYRGLARIDDGPRVDRKTRLAIVVTGFGGFLAYGGAALDEAALRAVGASDRESKVRVALITALEHGVLAIPCSAAAIALLALGTSKPPPSFTLPWAIAPAVGFAVGFWFAARYRTRLHASSGWRGHLSVALDAAQLVGAMFRHPQANRSALSGMLAFWLADMFALWAAMAAFGVHMNPGATVVALGTAMIVSRRTGPLGGAGILDVVLVPALWYSGVGWAPAVLGAFAYRFLVLWLPLPFSYLALPHLRELVQRAEQA